MFSLATIRAVNRRAEEKAERQRAALQKHGEQHGREAVLSVLASVGLPRLPGATPEQYGRVVAACAEPLL